MLRNIALLAVLLAAPAIAGDADISYRASVVAYSGCAIADTATSWGREELNPSLRGPGGQFGARGLAIKGIIAGASLGLQWLTRRHGQRGLWTLTNYVVASAWCGAATWNYRTR